jgi:hypothetical protein
MKRLSLISFILCILIISIFSSCDNENLDGIGILEGYHFESPDTTLSYNAQIVVLPLYTNSNDEYVEDFGIIAVNEKNYSSTTIDEEWNILILEFNEQSEYNADWAKLSIVNLNGHTMLKIELTENDTDTERALRIYAGKNIRGGAYCGEIIVRQKTKNTEDIAEQFTYKVRYKGIVYESIAYSVNNTITFEDSIFANFIANIESTDGVDMIIKENGIIDYIDNDDINKSPSLKSLFTRINAIRQDQIPTIKPLCSRSLTNAYQWESSSSIGYFAAFDDSNYGNPEIHFSADSLSAFRDEPYLRDLGLNDKISSLVVKYSGNDSDICAVLTVWEDSNYNYGDNDRTKHRLSFIASKYNTTIEQNKLKNIKCINSSNSWNDRISSLSFHFGNYGTALKDY